MRAAAQHADAQLVSYRTLRSMIGGIGVALPLALVLLAWMLFGLSLQPTMSDYYHTGIGDLFVGAMCAIGVFLFTYKGRQEKGDYDNTITNMAGVLAVGVALFPTTPDLAPTPADKAIGWVHVGCAITLFIALGFIALRVFTKIGSGEGDPRRPYLNRVYRNCGLVIFGAILLIVVYWFLPGSAKEQVRWSRPIFWLEAIAVMSFGLAWLVKGAEWARSVVASRGVRWMVSS